MGNKTQFVVSPVFPLGYSTISTSGNKTIMPLGFTGEPPPVNPVSVSDYDAWLTHYWPMEEDGSAVRADTVGILDLAPSGSITRAAGKQNYAVPQVNDGQHLTATGGAISGGSLLASLWFHLNWDTVIFGRQGVLSLHPENLLVAVYNYSSLFRVNLIAGQSVAVDIGDGFADNTTHHVLAYVEDGLQYLAVDGVYRGAGNTPVTFTDLQPDSRGEAVTPEIFKSEGWLDEVALWEGATLSLDDFGDLAQALYNGGDGVFYDGAAWA